jgi:hypothetical protein
LVTVPAPVVKYAVDPDPLANVPPLQLAASLQLPPADEVHVPSAAKSAGAKQIDKTEQTILVSFFIAKCPFSPENTGTG